MALSDAPDFRGTAKRGTIVKSEAILAEAKDSLGGRAAPGGDTRHGAREHAPREFDHLLYACNDVVLGCSRAGKTTDKAFY